MELHEALQLLLTTTFCKGAATPRYPGSCAGDLEAPLNTVQARSWIGNLPHAPDLIGRYRASIKGGHLAWPAWCCHWCIGHGVRCIGADGRANSARVGF
ncbi:hypothetical protein E4U41_005333 [Claviceps citrina]|nr:hypothetical protein E4U41_005333 [Claviceps citrina]